MKRGAPTSNRSRSPEKTRGNIALQPKHGLIDLRLGVSYSRDDLAKMLGYRGPHGLRRGVVTPANSNLIWLFVTERKDLEMTQFRDHLSENILRWEGPQDHFAEDRIIRSLETGDEIHLFFRPQSREPFKYCGILALETFDLNESSPSSFTFKLIDRGAIVDGDETLLDQPIELIPNRIPDKRFRIREPVLTQDFVQKPIVELLRQIDNSSLVLPAFQRSFVWRVEKTRQLLDSIVQGYPSGAMLGMSLNDSASNWDFGLRPISGANPLNRNNLRGIILDGQQRLTSLYQAFFGKGEFKHYIDLKKLLYTDCTFLDALITLKVDKRKDAEIINDLSCLENQAQQLIIPLTAFFGIGAADATSWLISAINSDTETIGKDLQRELSALVSSFSQIFSTYNFPWIMLEPKTSPEAVAAIFEVVNSSGQRLSVFDLMVAKCYDEDSRTLRQKWDEARSEVPGLVGIYGVDPVYALHVIALVSSYLENKDNSTPSCSKADILRLTKTQVQEYWNDSIYGLNKALEILKNDCGIFSKKWIPYMPQIITMAAVLAISERTPRSIGRCRKALIKWFWCCSLSSEYDQGAVSKVARDFKELARHIAENAPAPQVVRNFNSIDITRDLEKITPKNGAKYLALMALTVSNSPKDFYKLEKIDPGNVENQRIDDHHIFPKAYLKAKKIDSIKIDCILNRTLIDAQSNQSLGKSKPSKYFSGLVKTHGQTAFKALLDGHLIPSDVESGIFDDNYTTFLKNRKKLLVTKIDEVTSLYLE